MQILSLRNALEQLDDPRHRRGVRHPFAGIVTLMLLGMLARIREMEVLVRWAAIHWDQLREPLGFDRETPPCATTISRTLAPCSVGEFQAALTTWLKTKIDHAGGVAAVDGKTAKAALDGDRPLHMLNVLLHDLQVVVAQWQVGSAKTNEPTMLRRQREHLLETYPMLRLITGDAIFAQRPLVDLMRRRGCHYLFQIEANQGDTLDALEHCFRRADEKPPAAETSEKRGAPPRRDDCGLTCTTLAISAKPWDWPTARSRCAWTARCVRTMAS